MARFDTTIKVSYDADNAIHASGKADRIISVGREHGYFTHGEVVSVEPAPVLRYTQAEFDAAVLAAAENARQQALAEASKS